MRSIVLQLVHRRPVRRWARLALLSLSAFAIALCFGTPALGQSISFGPNGAASAEGLPPSEVTRYGVLEATWVESPVSKDRIFQIASPTVISRGDLSGEQIPVEVRAQNIEDLLWLEISRFRENALAEIFRPSAEAADDNLPTVQVVISTLQGLPVLQFSSSETSRPLTVATVTSTDADFYGEKPQKVAELWKDALEEEIALAASIYSPQAFRDNLARAVVTIGGLLLLTAVLTFVHWWLGRKQRSLKEQYNREMTASAQERSAAVSPQSAEANRAVVNRPSPEKSFVDKLKNKQLKQLLQHQLGLANRIDVYRTIRWGLVWLTVLSWYAGLYVLTTQLPILMQWRERLLTRPFILLLIWFITSLAIRTSGFLVQRTIGVWRERPRFVLGDFHRQAVRSQTIAGALKGLATSIIIIIGILLTLSQFGLPMSSLLAGGALLGLAISLGAQNIIKDVVNGCLILIEDQFAVGDVVTINGESGAVESLNLRLTQLRNLDGELISIPNGNIALVKNLTSSWSQVNLAILVAYDTDVDTAIAVIESVATELNHDERWKEAILEPPEILGVDDFDHNSLTLRVLIRTQPLAQWPVAREFRRRLREAFRQANILPPFSRQLVRFGNNLSFADIAHNLSGEADGKVGFNGSQSSADL